jgi:hypothetical protein
VREGSLAASVWAPWAELVVELGGVGTWEPSGPVWGRGQWGVDLWGSGYLSADFRNVTADVVSLDLDTGRNGIDDPGDVGTANMVLFDPDGAHGIAGEKELLGNLLRVQVLHELTGARRSIFYGKVIEARADESLAAPTISIRAVDLLGSVLSTDDATGCAAQSVRERLDDLLDRAAFPENMRVFDPDATRLLAVDKAGNRIDAARGAVSSSIGGTLFAAGDGTIRYEHGTTNIPPDAEPRYRVGTVAGAVCPTALALGEQIARVVNFYDWSNANQDEAQRLRAIESEPGSMHHYGRNSSVRTDLLNATAPELDELVHATLTRTAWAGECVEAVSFVVHDDASAELVLADIGELVEFTYTGADPWSSLQIIGRYSHHISPDEWTIDLGAYPPAVGALWGIGRWGVSAWA